MACRSLTFTQEVAQTLRSTLQIGHLKLELRTIHQAGTYLHKSSSTGDVAKSSLETAPRKRLYHYWTRNTDTGLFAQDHTMTDPVLSCHFLISFPSVPGGPFNSVTGLPDCTSAANRTSSNRTGSLLDRKTAKAQHCDSHVSCHDLFEALCQSLHSQEK